MVKKRWQMTRSDTIACNRRSLGYPATNLRVRQDPQRPQGGSSRNHLGLVVCGLYSHYRLQAGRACCDQDSCMQHSLHLLNEAGETSEWQGFCDPGFHYCPGLCDQVSICHKVEKVHPH